MKHIITRLRIEFATVWSIAIGTVALYHFNLLPNGSLQLTSTAYWLDVTTILLSISLSFFATRLFTLKTIRTRLSLAHEKGIVSYRRWSEVRIAMLAIPLFLSIATYYHTHNTNGIFCALIVNVAAFFCWPSEKKMYYECRTLQEGAEEQNVTPSKECES